LQADVAVKQGQLIDYEARLGKPFAHESYQRELGDLRDHLRLGLAELAEKINALRDANTV